MFRQLYNAVRRASYHEWETMGRFTMSTEPYTDAVASWLCTLFAKTIGPLYGVIIAATIIGGVVLLRRN